MNTDTPKLDTVKRNDLIQTLLIFGFTAIAFWPATVWLFQQTMAREQLMSALTVLGFAGFWIWRDNHRPKQPMFYLGKPVILLLLGSYALLALQSIIGGGIWTLMAYFVAIAAGILCILGPTAIRHTAILMSAFIGYVLFVITMDRLDWPLRGLAGQYGSWALSLLGKETQLGLMQEEQLSLLLFVDGRPFHVAAECNGFGLITASVLMSLLIGLYRRSTWMDTAIYVVAGLTVGFIGNILRITIIVLLAPKVDNYYLMHEIVGIICMYGSLGILYKIAPRSGRKNFG